MLCAPSIMFWQRAGNCGSRDKSKCDGMGEVRWAEEEGRDDVV